MTQDPIEIITKLQENHIDALQEVGNIGAGHSATALSQLLNRKVDMGVPRAAICSIEEFSTKVLSDPEEPLVAVVAETSGDILMHLVGLFDFNSIRHLMWVVRKQKFEDNLMKIPLLDKSFIREMGNILLLHYVSAITEFMDLVVFPDVPIIVIDMGKAILDSIISLKGVDYNTVLSIEVDIFTDQVQLKSTIVMLPDQPSLDKIMTRLFSEGWAQE